MVTYTKSHSTSFDRVTTLSTALMPSYIISKAIGDASSLGIDDTTTASEIIDIEQSLGALGVVVVENTTAGEVVDSVAGVTNGGQIIVTDLYVAIAYLDQDGFTVYKTSSDTVMNCEFSCLLPTKVLSSESSRLIGMTPNSYCWVDGGLLENFSGSDAVQLPECSYAYSEYGRLKAAFGITTGTLTMNYAPENTAGARCALLARKRMRVDGVEYDDKVGVYIKDSANVSDDISSFCSGSSINPTWCKQYVAPTSLAYSISVILSFAALNTESNREDSDSFLFVWSDREYLGSTVREFINGDETAPAYVYSSTNAIGSLLSNNAAYYNELLQAEIDSVNEALQTMCDKMTIAARSGVKTAETTIADTFEDINFVGDLSIPVPTYEYQDISTLSELASIYSETLGSVGKFLKFVYADDNGDTQEVSIASSSYVPDGSEQVELDSDSFEEYLASESGPVVSHAQALIDAVNESFSAFTTSSYTSSVPYDSDDETKCVRFSKDILWNNAHACHKSGHHCEDTMYNFDPDRAGYPHRCDGKRDSTYKAKDYRVVPDDYAELLSGLPYINDSGTLVSSGYEPWENTSITSVQIENYTKDNDAETVTYQVKCTIKWRPVDIVGYQIRTAMVTPFVTLFKAILEENLPADVVLSSCSLYRYGFESQESTTAAKKYAYKETKADGYGCLRGEKYKKLTACASCADPRYVEAPYIKMNVVLKITLPQISLDCSDTTASINLNNYGAALATAAGNRCSTLAAQKLIDDLTALGVLGDGELMYDVGAQQSVFMTIANAQQISTVEIDADVAKELIENLNAIRKQGYYDTSGTGETTSRKILSESESEALVQNMTAIANAAYMTLTLTPTDDDLYAYTLTDYTVTPTQPWYVSSLSGCVGGDFDGNLFPYYGALV